MPTCHHLFLLPNKALDMSSLHSIGIQPKLDNQHGFYRFSLIHIMIRLSYVI